MFYSRQRAARVAGADGVTLIEVAFTVLIIGILIAVALPGLKKPLAAYRLQIAAQEMAGKIRELQQRAISEETTGYKISFDTAAECYRLRKHAQILEEIYLPPAIDLVYTNFKDQSLEFTARGTPWPRGGTVTLQDTVSGEMQYVIVASITGRVRVSDEPPESWENS